MEHGKYVKTKMFSIHKYTNSDTESIDSRNLGGEGGKNSEEK